MKEQVILVNEQDQQIGLREKLEAHRRGELHRAFSVYIVNSRGELMLQQRASHKYHCGGLWTNTTCSHPRPDEVTKGAAHRRLREEMGFDTELEEVTEFIYKVPFENGLTEHEYLHVFIGKSEQHPTINKEEADSWKWISLVQLQTDLEEQPHLYTYWLGVTLPKIEEKLLSLSQGRS